MDTITGGKFPTGGVVKLNIHSNKIGYIKFANGTKIYAVDGIIDTIWSGAEMGCTFYIQKGVSYIDIDENCSLKGDIKINSTSSVYAAFCNYLTGINAPSAPNFGVIFCSYLTSFSAPLSTNTSTYGCSSLSQQSIYNAFDNAFILLNNGYNNGVLNFGGSTPAIDDTEISPVHSISYEAMAVIFAAHDWTIIYNS